MQNFTLYRLEFPDGKNYIGVTGIAFKRRWKNGYHHNKSILDAIKKYGSKNITKEILAVGLPEHLARHFERVFIKVLKTNDPNFGYNISQGGTTVSEETYQKLKDIGTKTKGKRVYQTKISGELVNTFDSIADAVRSLNKEPTSSTCYKLVRCCKKEKGHKTYHGFSWSFEKPLEK